MAYLDKIKQDTQRYFGSRQKIIEHEPGRIKDLTNPQNLGLFFCVKTKEELEQIRGLLHQIKGKYKKVEAFVFNPAYETLDVITHKSILLFDLNDFSLFGKMKVPLQEVIDNERFELLISFDFNTDPFTQKLVSYLHADFKIGPKQDDDHLLFDMTLKHSGKNDNFIDYYNQVIHYLSVLNIKST